MPKSKLILVVGGFIALLPALGFPPGWDTFFTVLGGASIVLLSVWSSIDRRLVMKAKSEKRLQRKRALVDAALATQDPDMYGRREEDKHPEAAVAHGRRAADVVIETEAPRPPRRAVDRKLKVKESKPAEPPKIIQVIDADMDDEPTL